MEVGDCMDDRNLAKDIIERKGGVAKSADFVVDGLRAAALRKKPWRKRLRCLFTISVILSTAKSVNKERLFGD